MITTVDPQDMIAHISSGPNEVKELAVECLDVLGNRLRFTHLTGRDRPSHWGPGQTAEVQFQHSVADVLLSDEGSFPQGIFHELLHVKFRCILKEPFIAPSRETLKKIHPLNHSAFFQRTNDHENLADHLRILKQELQLFQTGNHWRKCSVEASLARDPEWRETKALLDFGLGRYLFGRGKETEVENYLGQIGKLDIAEAFVDALNEHAEDKVSLIKTLKLISPFLVSYAPFATLVHEIDKGRKGPVAL